MRRFFSLVFIGFLIVIFGCSTGLVNNAPSKTLPLKPVVEPVWIDSHFSPQQRKDIEQGFKEWNYTLNGQLTYAVQKEPYNNVCKSDAKPEAPKADEPTPAASKDQMSYDSDNGDINIFQLLMGLKQQAVEEKDCTGDPAIDKQIGLTSQGLVVLYEKEGDTSVLGYVSGEDDFAIVHLFPTHFGNRSIKLVTKHEVGHLLGAKHNQVDGSIMCYWYGCQIDNLDEVTVRSITDANPEKFDFRTMKYYKLPE